MYLSDASQIRRADVEMIEGNHFPGILLMESAGRQTAEWILNLYPDTAHFLILAGPGNNGGDGWVIARYLLQAAKSVSIYCTHPAEKYKGDARINYEILAGRIQTDFYTHTDLADLLTTLPEDILIIDALLGTGVSGALRSPFDEIIELVKKSKQEVVAVDMPSGLDANTGKVNTKPISASFTFTFQMPKVCNFVTPAANYCGEVVVLDIGIWPEVVENLGIRRQVLASADFKDLKQREKTGHKGTFGHTLFIGGSKNMAGAIALAGNAALSSGAGLSTCIIPAAARSAFYANTLGVMTLNTGSEEAEFLTLKALPQALEQVTKKAAVAIGPGMGQDVETAKLLTELIPQIEIPLLIDADGLNLLANHPELWDKLPKHTILTPHPGEMARLCGREEVQENRLEIAEEFAKAHQVILVLKGANTIIALPDGQTFVNPTGNPGMGTAGMGDVLTGMITGLIAQGYEPVEATKLGVFLHGLAGDLMAREVGEEGVTAQGILPYIGKALLTLKKRNDG